jgi:hypothetical protein
MKRLVLAAGLVLGVLQIGPSVARADSPTCTSGGYLCAWSGTGFVTDSSGAWLQDRLDNPNWPGVGGFLDGGIENNDSSARSTSTSFHVRVFKFQQYGTVVYCVPAGGAFSALGANADKGSSHIWNTGAGC